MMEAITVVADADSSQTVGDGNGVEDVIAPATIQCSLPSRIVDAERQAVTEIDLVPPGDGGSIDDHVIMAEGVLDDQRFGEADADTPGGGSGREDRKDGDEKILGQRGEDEQEKGRIWNVDEGAHEGVITPKEAAQEDTDNPRRNNSVDDLVATSNGSEKLEESNLVQNSHGMVQNNYKGSDPVTAAAADNSTNTSRFAWDAPKHIFVLSSAGKPVFSLSGDEQQLSTLMGLIQGLLSLCADCGGGEGDDEMESISAGSRRFVFLRRGDLVLVAVSSASCCRGRGRHFGKDIGEMAEKQGEGEARAGWNGGVVNGARHESDDTAARCFHHESETFLRLQLEYLYSSILFLLTSKVQAVFRRSPGYDLRSLLGGADSSLKGVIDLAEPARGRGRMLAGGVETVWMDPTIRARVASGLQAVQSAAALGALYAIWLCGEELIALAQPRAPWHRLHSQDLLLLVNFVATQPALRTAESWTPVCFPRFQEQGYLYTYIAFLDNPERPSAERPCHAAQNSRQGAKGPRTAMAANGDDGGSNSDGNSDEENTRGGDSCLIILSTEASAEQFQAFRRSRAVLEARFRSALGLNWNRYLGTGARAERTGILKRFCSQLNALHFFYCLRGRRGGAPCVNQVLSSPFVHVLANDREGQRRIWGHYTRAALRLRRGSSQEGRVFCRDGENGCAAGEHQVGAGAGTRGAGSTSETSGYGGVAEATAIFEADPVHSLAYEIGATETVVSLFGQREDGPGGSRWSLSGNGGGGGSWGERDELHVCFPSGVVSTEEAYKAAVRLVAIIRRDREWLFFTGTGASK